MCSTKHGLLARGQRTRNTDFRIFRSGAREFVYGRIRILVNYGGGEEIRVSPAAQGGRKRAANSRKRHSWTLSEMVSLNLPWIEVSSWSLYFTQGTEWKNEVCNFSVQQTLPGLPEGCICTGIIIIIQSKKNQLLLSCRNFFKVQLSTQC